MKLILIMTLMVFLPVNALAKNCKTGKPCGNSCIARNKTCNMNEVRRVITVPPTRAIPPINHSNQSADIPATRPQPTPQPTVDPVHTGSRGDFAFSPQLHPDYSQPVDEFGRMFVWKNDNDVPIMSGRRPPWYGNSDYSDAPRTQVWLAGKLIDDTAEIDPIKLAHYKAIRLYLLNQANIQKQQIEYEAYLARLKREGKILTGMERSLVELILGKADRIQRRSCGEESCIALYWVKNSHKWVGNVVFDENLRVINSTIEAVIPTIIQVEPGAEAESP